MKNKFSIHDLVQTGTASGRVQEVAPVGDHYEYLVAFPDHTAAWLHEAQLSPGSSARAASEESPDPRPKSRDATPQTPNPN